MRRVAIMGLGGTHDEQPDSWERWGIAKDGWAPRYDCLFEMHDRSLWKDDDAYIDRINDMGIPVWTREVCDDFPSVPYPLWGVAAVVGDYFGSSVAYMVALAIYEGVDHMGLWGVDLHEKDGYDHQRPNLEYLLGFAMGRGIAITIPEGSALLKYRPDHVYNGHAVTFPRRYGCLHGNQ